MAELNERPTNATTVAQTSKSLKLQKLLAIIAVIIGGTWMWTTSQVDEPSMTGVWILLFGALWYIVTRVRIWWHHS